MIALHRQSIRSTIRAITLVAAITSLLLTMVTPFVGTARAAHDVPYDASNGALDDPSFTMLGDDCGGNSDSVAKGGTKLDTIHLDDPPVLTESSVTPKDNLCEFWADSAVDSHGNVWLYLAFTREATSGTAHVAIELLNDAADCDVTDYANCNPWEDRTSGTRIVGFTWQGNDGLVSPTLWTFNGSGFNAGQPLGSAFTGSTGSGGAFGEAAINLTAAGILPNVNDPAAACELLAAMIPLTLPGLSLGSQPKDVVLGNAPPISTCGTLVIEKVVDGGDDFGDSFVGTATGASTLTTEPLGHGDSDTFPNLKAGSFTVAEKIGDTTLAIGDTVDGWTLTNIDCGDGSATEPDTTAEVVAGETTTCTLYNAPDLPELTLLKDVVNDNGGQAIFSDFTATTTPDEGIAFQDADAANPTSTEVEPGSYTLGEVDPGPGYVLTSIDCDDDAYDTTDSTTEVTLELGDDVTCTFTNDDQPGTIIVEKTIVDPDELYPTATQDDFTPTIDGDEVDWDAPGTTVDAGTYPIDEVDGAAGYLTDGRFVHSSTVCDDQDGGSSATVGLAETITCTITNTAVGAGLVLVKDVDNEWGGSLTAGDFELQVNGDTVGEGQDLITYPAGEYTIRELQEPGYEFDGLECLEGGEEHPATPVDGQSETFTVVVAAGESVVCTFTNSDLPGELTVWKDVINDDGGDAVADDFTSEVGYTPASENVAEDNEPDAAPAWGVTQIVPQGDYVVGESEDMPDGYSLVGVACYDSEDVTDGVPNQGATPISETGEVTISFEDAVDCIVTNDDNPIQLTLVKQVINDHGGTATADQFGVRLDETVRGLTIDDTPDEGVDSQASVTITDLDAGTYTVDELGAADYTLDSIECDNGDGGTPSAEVTLELGDDVTCTLVNDDDPASLTVVKQVVNDDGGDAAATEFGVSVDGDALELTSETPDDGADDQASTTLEGLSAGTYVVGEAGAAGYTLESIECTNEDGGTPTADVALGIGDDVTCTLVNDDIAPTVVLRKTVVNDDGGTLTQDDFPVTLDGDEAAWDETITTTAGDHLAAELTQPGYVAGDWGGDCAADGSLTAELAGTYECTITNDDVPAGLTVVKQVVNDDGGTAVAGDFPLTVTPEGGEAQVVQSGSQTIVGAGTYTISEEQQPGYALESISCDNGTTTTEGSIDVTVGLDEVVTCTIVNDDLPISIQVVKVPDVTEIDFTAGGEEEVVTYTYTVTNTGELPLSDLSLVDDILGEITLPVDELAVGQVVFGTAEHVVTQADADAGTIVNVAVVEGTSPDGRTTDDDDDAEVAVNLIEVAPQVIEKAPVLPATGFETMRLALWAALVSGLGVLFLLATDEARYARRRRD